MRIPLSRLAGVLLVLAGLACLRGQAGRVVAQAGGAPLRYTGTLVLSGSGADPGTTITVVTLRSPTDYTVCGMNTVSDTRGSYAVDIGALPDCFASSTRGAAELVFVSGGENVGTASVSTLFDYLAFTPPQTSGPLLLTGTRIPGFRPGPEPGGAILPLVRYYGTLTLAAAPAPAGTVIAVQGSRALQGAAADCGSGTVADEQGHYWVDVRPIAACAADLGGGGAALYRFVVNGETVGSAEYTTSLDQGYLPAMGHSTPLQLAGHQPPPAPAAATCDPGSAQPPDAATVRWAQAPQLPLVQIAAAPGTDLACFTAAIRACYYQYQQWGGPAAQLTQDLSLDATVPAGTNRVAIAYNPTSRTGTQDLGGSAAITIGSRTGGTYPDGATRTFCSTLLHELLHAQDIVGGSIIPGELQLRVVRFSDGALSQADQTLPLSCEELQVLINENRARQLATQSGVGPALSPRPTYPNLDETFGLVLPGAVEADGSAVYPADLFGFDAVNPPLDPVDAGPCGLI